MALTCVFTSTDSPYLAEKCTGLGNVLFQIAALYGIAKETGRTVEYANLETLNEKLKILTGHDYTKTIFRNVPLGSKFQYDQHVTCPHNYMSNFKQELNNFIKEYTRNICFNGHFESYHYFSSCEAEIQSMFSPDPDSLAFMNAKYPILFDSSKKCGSIHIRKNHPNFTDEIDYIKRALEYLPRDVTYIVLSNDMKIVEQELAPINNNFIFVGNNLDFIDMWIISMCRYNIMSHSTMSWWGSFLNTRDDKIVICPKTMQKIYPGPICNFYFKTYIQL